MIAEKRGRPLKVRGASRIEGEAIEIAEILAGSECRPHEAPGIKFTVEQPLLAPARGKIFINPIGH